jgi:hypothetical protein
MVTGPKRAGSPVMPSDADIVRCAAPWPGNAAVVASCEQHKTVFFDEQRLT